MYKRKIKEDLDCGLYVTMKILGAKWKPCIIDAIARGARRPSEIHKQITSTSPRVLGMRLGSFRSVSARNIPIVSNIKGCSAIHYADLPEELMEV